MRQCAWICGNRARTRWPRRASLALCATWTLNQHGVFAVIHHPGAIALGAEFDVGDIIQTNVKPPLLSRMKRFLNSSIDSMLVEAQVELHHLALGLAERRQVVVGSERAGNFARGQAVRCELLGFSARTRNGETLFAHDRGLLHAPTAWTCRLHNANQIVADLVWPADPWKVKAIITEPKVSPTTG